MGEDVLITGAGPIGIMGAAVARHVGARHVVITDMNPERLQLATEVADVVPVNIKEQKLRDVMDKLGMKVGFDVGLEMSGAPAALDQMIDHMVMGGRVALLGVPAQPFIFDLSKIVFRMITLRGIGLQHGETPAMLESGLDVRKVIARRMKSRRLCGGLPARRRGREGQDRPRLDLIGGSAARLPAVGGSTMLRTLFAGLLVALAAPALAQAMRCRPAASLRKALIGFADGARIGFTESSLPNIREIAPGVSSPSSGRTRSAPNTRSAKPRPVWSRSSPKWIRRRRAASPPTPAASPPSTSSRAPSTREYRVAVDPHRRARFDRCGERVRGPSSETTLDTTFYSTVPLAEMEAAGAALLARCAGIAPPPPVTLADASAVDLLATIFAGISEGTIVEMSHSLRGAGAQDRPMGPSIRSSLRRVSPQ